MLEISRVKSTYHQNASECVSLRLNAIICNWKAIYQGFCVQLIRIFKAVNVVNGGSEDEEHNIPAS